MPMLLLARVLYVDGCRCCRSCCCRYPGGRNRNYLPCFSTCWARFRLNILCVRPYGSSYGALRVGGSGCVVWRDDFDLDCILYLR